MHITVIFFIEFVSFQNYVLNINSFRVYSEIQHFTKVFSTVFK